MYSFGNKRQGGSSKLHHHIYLGPWSRTSCRGGDIVLSARDSDVIVVTLMQWDLGVVSQADAPFSINSFALRMQQLVMKTLSTARGNKNTRCSIGSVGWSRETWVKNFYVRTMHDIRASL